MVMVSWCQGDMVTVDGLQGAVDRVLVQGGEHLAQRGVDQRLRVVNR